MLFSQTAEYALRAVSYLASQEAEAWVKAAEIAPATGIPVHYVSKVMRRLTAAGLVHGQKGHHGGFQLAKPPERLRFSDVLEAMDENLEEKRCAFGWSSCGGRNPCPLHPAFNELAAEVRSWAKRTTFAGLRPVRLPLAR